MRLAWAGLDLLFTHPEFRGRIEPVEEASDVHAKKREMGFRLWGGEKTWLAPQARWADRVPFLDLDSGRYEAEVLAQDPDRVCVRMSSPICRETGMRIIRTITVESNEPGIDVHHELVNASSEPVEWGLWSVAQFLKPGCVYLPRRRQSRHPSGVKTFSEEGKSELARNLVVREVGSLVQILCQDAVAFKFGVDATEGWLLGICDRPEQGLFGYLTKYRVPSEALYGHDCTAEVYNSGHFPYLEIEVHSPLFRLGPGEHATFRETRALFPLPEIPSDEGKVRTWVTQAGA
ncbi:MAG: hypothetical protein ACE5NC_01775 [Anaerolineae bacterium]